MAKTLVAVDCLPEGNEDILDFTGIEVVDFDFSFFLVAVVVEGLIFLSIIPVADLLLVPDKEVDFDTFFIELTVEDVFVVDFEELLGIV